MTAYNDADLHVHIAHDGPLSRWGADVDGLLGNGPPTDLSRRILARAVPTATPVRPMFRPTRAPAESPSNEPGGTALAAPTDAPPAARTADDWLALAEWFASYLLVITSMSLVLACGIGFGPMVWVFAVLWWALTGWWLRYRRIEARDHDRG